MLQGQQSHPTRVTLAFPPCRPHGRGGTALPGWEAVQEGAWPPKRTSCKAGPDPAGCQPPVGGSQGGTQQPSAPMRLPPTLQDAALITTLKYGCDPGGPHHRLVTCPVTQGGCASVSPPETCPGFIGCPWAHRCCPKPSHAQKPQTADPRALAGSFQASIVSGSRCRRAGGRRGDSLGVPCAQDSRRGVTPLPPSGSPQPGHPTHPHFPGVSTRSINLVLLGAVGVGWERPVCGGRAAAPTAPRHPGGSTPPRGRAWEG